MKLKYLKAENYRNITSAHITFSPGVNLFLGENAQGKTNALEAIYTFARGKSFRGAKDSELIRFGEKGYKTEIGFFDGKREQTLSLRLENREKIREKNGIRLEKQTEMLGIFRAVLFCPEHLNMVKEGPGERRQFLNIAISQCYPAYLNLYAEYAKCLEDRNALLKFSQKTGFTDLDEIQVFSESLARLSAEIYCYRTEYVSRLAPHAKEIHQRLSGGREELSVAYECGFSPTLSKKEAREVYEKMFSSSLQREIAAGCSLFGVHRDELSLIINGISAREYGSQGQQRTAVLALKLAEGEVCGEIVGEEPVYLFDDVLSELDEGRRSVVIKGEEERQYVITACDQSVYKGEANCIKTEGGIYVSSYR